MDHIKTRWWDTSWYVNCRTLQHDILIKKQCVHVQTKEWARRAMPSQQLGASRLDKGGCVCQQTVDARRSSLWLWTKIIRWGKFLDSELCHMWCHFVSLSITHATSDAGCCCWQSPAINSTSSSVSTRLRFSSEDGRPEAPGNLFARVLLVPVLMLG